MLEGFISCTICNNAMTFIFRLRIFLTWMGIFLGVYISQQIRFARMSNHVTDFNTRNKLLTAKLLNQSYRYHKLNKALFLKFNLASKFNVELKSLLQQGLPEPGDLVYKFRKKYACNDFSPQFRKIVLRYIKIRYNLKEIRQTAYMVVNPITVNNFASLFGCTQMQIIS